MDSWSFPVHFIVLSGQTLIGRAAAQCSSSPNVASIARRHGAGIRDLAYGVEQLLPHELTRLFSALPCGVLFDATGFVDPVR